NSADLMGERWGWAASAALDRKAPTAFQWGAAAGAERRCVQRHVVHPCPQARQTWGVSTAFREARWWTNHQRNRGAFSSRFTLPSCHLDFLGRNRDDSLHPELGACR